MNISEEKLNRIKAEYGENAYEQYLNAENAIKGKDLSQLDRDWHIGQSYGKPNAYIMKQHREIDDIVNDREMSQEQIDAIAKEAAKAILG